MEAGSDIFDCVGDNGGGKMDLCQVPSEKRPDPYMSVTMARVGINTQEGGITKQSKAN